MIPEGIAGCTRQPLYCGRGRLDTLLDGAAGAPFLLDGFVAESFFPGFIISGAFFLHGVCTRLFDAFRQQLCLTGFRRLNLALRPGYIPDLAASRLSMSREGLRKIAVDD